LALLPDGLPREIVSNRDSLLLQFLKILADSGVQHPRHFIQNAQSLGFTGKDWLPHVTIARLSDKRATDQNIRSLTVRLGRLRARNITSLQEWKEFHAQQVGEGMIGADG
jgi:hypothetical protein